jgi:hypothetical protein
MAICTGNPVNWKTAGVYADPDIVCNGNVIDVNVQIQCKYSVNATLV